MISSVSKWLSMKPLTDQKESFLMDSSSKVLHKGSPKKDSFGGFTLEIPFVGSFFKDISWRIPQIGSFKRVPLRKSPWMILLGRSFKKNFLRMILLEVSSKKDHPSEFSKSYPLLMDPSWKISQKGSYSPIKEADQSIVSTVDNISW